jgi:surfeit locus 1 family protein
MPIRRPLLLPIIATALFAVVCTQLGFWQLSRLSERRTFNAQLAARLAAPPSPISALPSDTAAGHYHRVSARGVFDYPRQVVLATRSSMGSPGVHVLTPLRLDDGTIAMVNRGWVYAPDAITIDGAKWREHEGDSVTVRGYAETWSGRERAPLHDAQRAVRALDSSRVAHLVGAPIRPYFVAQTSDSTPVNDRPVRLGEPELAEGSHRGYAIQWFSFALVALIGGSLLVREELVRRRASA